MADPEASQEQPRISAPAVHIETGAGFSPTRVLSVTWTVETTPAAGGDWSVEWDDMYGDLLHPSDPASSSISAHSEQGNYFALQRPAGGTGASSAVATPNDTSSRREDAYAAAAAAAAVVERDDGPDYGDDGGEESTQATPRQAHTSFDADAPLSTARLLEFENGVHGGPLQDLPAFFAARPLVQAPAELTPTPSSSSPKAAAKIMVFFLLAATTPPPPELRILFTPAWTRTTTPPHVLATVAASSFARRDRLHSAWARARLADLAVLADIAAELEREGARGSGTGRLKIGVEGGGMDEEAVRREGWMVGEEAAWVRDRFLPPSPPPPQPRAQQPVPTKSSDTLTGLGLGLGIDTVMLGGAGSPSAMAELVSTRLDDGSPAPPVPAAAAVDGHLDSEDETEEDLFALPLSPRSPDMAVSPFSAFRGPAPAEKPGSKLRYVTVASAIDGGGAAQAPTRAAAAAGDGGSGNANAKSSANTPRLGGRPPTPPRDVAA